MENFYHSSGFFSNLNRFIGNIEENSFLKRYIDFDEKKANILIVGSSGVGKSSTINSLFGENVAKISNSFETGTFSIKEYKIKNLKIFDSPGFGDTSDNEEEFKKELAYKLMEEDENGNQLIDVVLVLFDAGSRDFSTIFKYVRFLKEYITENRIIIALNKIDRVHNGDYWNKELNEPIEGFKEKINEDIEEFKNKIYKELNLKITPIYYSAGYKNERTGEIYKPYNLQKLMYHIINRVPSKKRIVVSKKINEDDTKWENNDKNYEKNIFKDIVDGLIELAKESIPSKLIGKGIEIITGFLGF